MIRKTPIFDWEKVFDETKEECNINGLHGKRENDGGRQAVLSAAHACGGYGQTH